MHSSSAAWKWHAGPTVGNSADLLAGLFLPWNRWLAGERLNSPVRVEAVVHRASCWALRGHPYWGRGLEDLLAASEPVVGDPHSVASSGEGIPREPSREASAVPGGAAYPDEAEAAIGVALHAAPSADGADPVDAAAYAAVVDRVVRRDHRVLAYGAVEAALLDLVVGEDRSCAADRAGVEEVHGDWVVEVRAEGDPAFAYAHLAPLAVAPEDHADEADPVPVPYVAGPEVVPAAVDTDYAVTEMERGFAKAAPLDSVPGAEA